MVNERPSYLNCDVYNVPVPKTIGDYCKYQPWCHTRLGTNVLCENNQCVCKDRFLINDTENGCVPCKSVKFKDSSKGEEHSKLSDIENLSRLPGS